MNYSYIAVEGLIGAGKTTLCKALSEKLNARLLLEEFEENPFLPGFYSDPDRYGFSVELSFLAQRYHQLKTVGERDLFQPLTIADYSIGKSLVFAQTALEEVEFKLFRELYDIMYTGLPHPELIVYLHMPLERVRSQIAHRGRDYEMRISEEYLERVQDHYMDHFQKSTHSSVVLLEVPDVHLVNDSGAFGAVLDILEEVHPPGLSIRSLKPL